MSRVAENFRRVRDRVDRAAARAGRDGAEVDICAVTKRVDLPAIREAVAAGARLLGENRVQEAAEKIPQAGDLGERVRWHLIGHLQRNKARKAVDLFHAIQSVDSVALARRIAGLGKEKGCDIPVFLEVLTSDEGTKAGLPIQEVPEVVAEVRELNGLSLQGLMTMAPFTEEEAPVRKSFAALRELRERCGEPGWDLSMGMTGDFEIAVEEGSTLVRVGTGIFD